MVRKSIWNESERHNRRRIRITLHTSSKITNPTITNHFNGIKPASEDTKFMRKIFGPKTNWTVVANMEDAEKHLWSQGVKAVYRTLIQ